MIIHFCGKCKVLRAERIEPTLTKKEKALALIEEGLADSLSEAYEMLEDMGEDSDRE